METEVVATTMATILADVSTIFTKALAWVGEVASTITGEPLLLIFCIIPLIGLGIGMFKRLLNV